VHSDDRGNGLAVCQAEQNPQIDRGYQKALRQLGTISTLFPKFLERSENLTSNWVDEMSWRQSALKN
jgi:hypothetical protein